MGLSRIRDGRTAASIIKNLHYAFSLVIRFLTIAGIIAGLAYFLVIAAHGQTYEVKPLNAPISGAKIRTSQSYPYPPATTPRGQISAISTTTVRDYILKQAKTAGVNPIVADFVVRKESDYNVNAIGDNGISFGAWQFNLKANPQISVACALDLKCSTALALQWIIAGKISSWSTFKNCKKWYQECPM